MARANNLLVGICLLTFASVAFAQDPTPTATATATATPSACTNIQTCVDTQVPAAVASCAAAEPTCTKNVTVFAATAGEIAERALEGKNCDKKNNRALCNACYLTAKGKLQNRFFFKLFKGMLANAVAIIEAERKATCLEIGKNSPRGPKTR